MKSNDSLVFEDFGIEVVLFKRIFPQLDQHIGSVFDRLINNFPDQTTKFVPYIEINNIYNNIIYNNNIINNNIYNYNNIYTNISCIDLYKISAYATFDFLIKYFRDLSINRRVLYITSNDFDKHTDDPDYNKIIKIMEEFFQKHQNDFPFGIYISSKNIDLQIDSGERNEILSKMQQLSKNLQKRKFSLKKLKKYSLKNGLPKLHEILSNFNKEVLLESLHK